MPTDKAVLQQINTKMNKVLATKSWVSDLNFVPLNAQAVRAMNSLLDYISMLQDQVKGLEEQIRKLR